MHGRQHGQELQAVLAPRGTNVGGQLPGRAGLTLEKRPIARGDQARHAGRLHEEVAHVRHHAVQLAMAACAVLSW